MRIVTAVFLMIVLSMTLTLPAMVLKANAVDAAIVSLVPTSHRGKVGDTVQIAGTINTTNGLYQIWFSQHKVIEANATANNVSAMFQVPSLPQGNYTITLLDTNKNVNATTWFYIDTAYYIQAKLPAFPQQLQEGSKVEIWANITGGVANTVYSANITVASPTPSNKTHWALFALTNTTTTGEGYNTTIIYPDHFSGVLYTNYTGAYNIAFNKTTTNTFSIGLTNATEYHRNQFVDIKAVGYKPNENATLKIGFGGKSVYLNNVTATSTGLISSSWVVPANASMGTYTVNVTSTSANATIKIPPDVQTFIIPGFDINVTTRNLAKETVSNVIVQIFEDGKSIVNGTSVSNGLVQVQLELGNYTFKAVYKGEKVRELPINVTGPASTDLYCDLTNLKVVVKAVTDGLDLFVPNAKVYLTPENKNLETDLNGTVVAASLLPNHTYTLNVSRYDTLFNVTVIPTLLENGLAKDWCNITLLLPTLQLQVNATKADGEPISNVPIKARELMGGPLYEGNTSAEGVIVFNCPFGKYEIEINDIEGVRLNGTTVNLFQNKNVSLICKLYGLAISVRIIDYFGQPISNANITLQRGDSVLQSIRTQLDGVATFNNITGGNLQVAIYITNQLQPDIVKAFEALNPTAIDVKMEEYVVLAGILVSTAILMTTIVIIVALLFILLIEVYRRRHIKPQKSAKQ